VRGLSPEQQANVLAAIRFLRIRVGNWKLLAKTLEFQGSTMKNVMKGINPVSVNMAFRIAKLAQVPFDDVTSGKYPVKGTCPHCGQGPNALGPT
jgi:hypothetical protein